MTACILYQINNHKPTSPLTVVVAIVWKIEREDLFDWRAFPLIYIYLSSTSSYLLYNVDFLGSFQQEGKDCNWKTGLTGLFPFEYVDFEKSEKSEDSFGSHTKS